MAFNINAHVILQGPKNIKAVTNSIKQQLAGISVPVNLQTGQVSSASSQISTLNKGMKQLQASAASTSKSLKNVGIATTATAGGFTKAGAATGRLNQNLKATALQTQKAVGAMQMLGRETALTFKRFAAAGIVTATIFRLGGAIAEATGNALEFQREMVKLEQVTGKTAAQLGGLKNAITSTSKELGISANELSNIARLFSQTGQSIREVEASMRAIARSSLAPTFGDMEQTAEGLIAALAQFGIKASDAEKVLGSINKVSKKFAVESQDLIAAVRRAGGVFATAAGQFKDPIQSLNEFNAVFTAVRSTTRESAETIATGLRTIFTRLQRRGTIDMLKGLGIELTNTEGKFIGLYESFKVLSKELDRIVQKGDAVTLSAITEELGGMRQVGKLIPAIREFQKAERALAVGAQGAVEGLGADVKKGLVPLIKQFEILGSRFEDFIRKISDSSTFQNLARFAIDTANAFITLGESLAPILPLLTQLAAMKIAKGAFAFGQGFFGSTKGMGGAGGLGARVGGVVAGKPTGGAATPVAPLNNNTTALKSNNTALGTLSKAITTNFTSSSKNLIASMDRLGKVISSAPRGAARGGRRGFSAGGLVPGRGNRDTVPAMLTPGEFVINKGSTSAIGAGNLAGMNRYAGGGKVRRTKNYYGNGIRPSSLASGNAQRVEVGKLSSRRDVTPTGRATSDSGEMINVDLLTPAEARKYKSQVNALSASEAGDVYGGAFLRPAGLMQNIVAQLNKNEINRELIKLPGYKILQTANDPDARSLLGDINKSSKKAFKFSLRSRGLGKGVSESVENSIYTGVKQAMELGSQQLASSTRSAKITASDDAAIMKNANIDNVIGNVFEMILLRAGVPFSEKDRDAANAPFDFPAGLGSIAPNFGSGLETVATDAKSTFNNANIKSFLTKAKNKKAQEYMAKLGPTFERIGNEIRSGNKSMFPTTSTNNPRDKYETKRSRASDYFTKGKGRGYNKGGRATGTDTVPALLTPGEFVINKSSAQSIGYGNLKEMNRYAAGGVVRRGKGRYGTMPPPGGGMNPAMGGMSALGEAAMSTAFALMMLDFSTLEGTIMSLVMIGTALPSVITSLKMLPGIIGGLRAGGAMQAYSRYSSAAANAAGSAAPMALGASVARNAPFGQTMMGGMMTGVLGKGGAGGAAGGAAITTAFKKGADSLKATLLKLAKPMGFAMGAALGATAGVLIGGYIGRQVGEMLAGKKIKGRVEGVEGYAGGAGAAKTAVVAEAAGSMGGVAAIAGAIALFNPMMAGLTLVIGGLYTAAKALSDWHIALAKQAEFESFEKLGKSVDNATEALDRFIQAGSGASSRQINALTDRIGTVFEDQAASAGMTMQAAISERQYGLEGSGTGAMVGGAIGAVVAGIAAVVTGGIATPLAVAIVGIGATIGASIEKMGDFFDFTGSGRQADTLEVANKQLEALTEEFVAKMNEAFGKMVESFIGQADFMSGNETLPKLAALIQTVDQGDQTVDQAAAQFRALQGAMEETGNQGKALSKFMEQKLFVGLQNSMKSQSELVKSTFGAAISLGIDPTNIDQLRDRFVDLEEVTGHNREELEHTVDTMANLIRIENERNVQMLAQAARQEMMNRVLKKGTVIIDMFVVAVERLAKAGKEASDRFKMAADDLSGFAAKTMAGGGGGIQISDRGMINPFDNLETSTQAAIDSGIQRVGGMSGMDTSGMSEMLRVQQILPDLLQNVARVAENSNNGQIATREQLLTILKDELGKLGIAFEKLPPAIQSSLKAGLDVSAGRQGQDSISLRGALEGEDFQGLLSRFGEASEKARAALAGFYTSITQAQKSLISIINESIKLEQSRIDASLKALDILQRTNSTLERFGNNTDYIARANRNLFEKLGAIGSGATSLNAAQQQQNVENLRGENANLRSQLGAAGLPDPNANATELQSQLESGQLAGFDAATRDLIDRLVENEKAIERETKALEALTDDTSRLEAVNQTLADIQKAQMTAEQQSKYFMNQMSRVEGESDPIRRGQMLREIMLPFASFSKAMSGGTLSMQEFNSMMSNFDSQIAPILRSQGASEQDIESARQGFFAKFASEFPGVFNAAVSSSFLAVEGPIQGILDAISQSMAPAGKPFEDLSSIDFPALFKPAMDEFGVQMGSTVKGIMEAAKKIAADQAAAVVQEQKDRASKVEEAIKKQIGALEKDAEKIDAHKKALKDANSELANFKRSLKKAGKKANDLLDIQNKEAKKNEEEAQAATDAQDERGKIVPVERQRRAGGTPFGKGDTEQSIYNILSERLKKGRLDEGALKKLAQSVGLSLTKTISESVADNDARQGVRTETRTVDKSSRELLDDIFGEGDLLGSNFAGLDLSEFDDIADAIKKVTAAGFMKEGGGVRTEIEFKRVDASKLDEGLEAYEKGYLERLKKQSLASDKAWQDRLDDIKYSEGGDKLTDRTGVLFDRILDELVEMGTITGEAAARARETASFNVERVGGGSLQKGDLLSAQARIGRERIEQKNNESRGGNVNKVYQELRNMGKDDAADALLQDLDVETQAQIDTASNTSETVAVLRQIRDAQSGDIVNQDTTPISSGTEIASTAQAEVFGGSTPTSSGTAIASTAQAEVFGGSPILGQKFDDSIYNNNLPELEETVVIGVQKAAETGIKNAMSNVDKFYEKNPDFAAPSPSDMPAERIKPKDFNKGLAPGEKGLAEGIDPPHGFQPIRNALRARRLNKQRGTTAGDLRRDERQNRKYERAVEKDSPEKDGAKHKTQIEIKMGIGKVSKGIEDVKKAVEKRGEEFNKENLAPPLTVPKGANGGYLTGPSHSQGGIKAELEGGEYVLKKQSVAMLGKQRLDYMNATGKLPKFRAGGPVGAGFTSGGIGMNVSSINSMEDLMALVDQLGPLSGPIEFMQMLQQMDQFSGGNGMQAILNSPMMGEIMQKLQQKQIDHFTKLYGMGGAQGAIQQQAAGIGGSSPRAQLDKEFQSRLGGITGGLNSKRGQTLNNLLKKFDSLAKKVGGVDAAAGTSGGANILAGIEKTLKRYGMAPDAIEETMKMYKSLLQDEARQKKEEIKLLKDMGIYEKPKKFKGGAQNPMMGPIMGMLGMGNMMSLQGKMGGGMVMPGMGGMPGMSGMGPAILGGMAGQTGGFQNMFNNPIKQFLQSIGMGGMGGMMGQHNLGAGGLGGGLGILGGMNPIGFNPNLIPGGGNRALQMGGGRGGMLGGGGGLCDCFTAAIDKLIAFLAGEEVSIGGGAGGGAGGAGGQILTNLIDVLKKAWEGLKNFGSTLWETAKKIGSPIINAFKDTFGKGTMGAIIDAIGSGIKPIWDGIKNVGESIFNGIKSIPEGVQKLKDFGNGIKDLGSSALDAASNFDPNSLLQSIGGLIGGGLGGVGTLIGEKVGDLITPTYAAGDRRNLVNYSAQGRQNDLTDEQGNIVTPKGFKAGRSSYQGPFGSDKQIRESRDRMVANKAKFDEQIAKAEAARKKAGKGEFEKGSYIDRIKAQSEALGLSIEGRDNYLGIKPEEAKAKAKKEEAKAQVPNEQLANQLKNNMGITQRKVKLTDTPLAAAKLIIDFLKNNCLKTEPCSGGAGGGGGLLTPNPKLPLEPIDWGDLGPAESGPAPGITPMPGFDEDGNPIDPRPSNPNDEYIGPAWGGTLGGRGFDEDAKPAKKPEEVHMEGDPDKPRRSNNYGMGTAAEQARKKREKEASDEYIKYGTQGGQPVMVDLYNNPRKNPNARLEGGTMRPDDHPLGAGGKGAFEYQQFGSHGEFYGAAPPSAVYQSSSPKTNEVIDAAQKTIDETKKMLMEKYGMSEDEYNKQMKEAGTYLQGGGSLGKPTNPAYNDANWHEQMKDPGARPIPQQHFGMDGKPIPANEVRVDQFGDFGGLGDGSTIGAGTPIPYYKDGALPLGSIGNGFQNIEPGRPRKTLADHPDYIKPEDRPALTKLNIPGMLGLGAPTKRIHPGYDGGFPSERTPHFGGLFGAENSLEAIEKKRDLHDPTLKLPPAGPTDLLEKIMEGLGSGRVGGDAHPEATTPLLSDETAFISAVDNLRGIFEGGGTVFTNFDLVVKGMKEAANLIPKIPEEIKLTLQTPEVTVKVMAADVQNQIGKVVQGAIDSAIARKFEARVKSLEATVNNDGMGTGGL